MKRFFLPMVVALAASLGDAGSASAGVTYWQAETANWSEPAAWSDGEPDFFIDAGINNGGTAVIDHNGEFADRLLLGTSAGETGNVVQSGGSVTIDSVYVAFGEGTQGEYRLAGGSLNAQDVIVGQAGTGNFIHTSGQNVSMTALIVGWAPTGQGTYQLTGTAQTRIVADDEHIGRAGVGVLTQTGGTNMVSANLTLGGNGAYPGGSGTYNLLYGELRLLGDPGQTISLAAHDGTATFRLGDAWDTGTIRELLSDEGVNLTVRESPSGTATFQGWGTVPLTGVLKNNGRVVADGYGTDRTLDLSTFSSVTNDLDVVQSDGTQAGWYAQNGGKLTLPPVEVEPGSNSYNWGENAAGTSLDLVNSVRIDLTDVTSGGDFSVDLLAGDRADVLFAGDLLLLGVWGFNPPAGFGAQAADLTFRYDDVRAAELGLNEPNVYAYDLYGKTWVAATDARDPIGHTVSANNVDSFLYYAVGSFLPVLNSSASSLWRLPSTWDRQPMTPGADRRAVVRGHTVTVDSDGAAFSLEISDGGRLAVGAGKTLSIEASATVGSDATLTVDGTLTAARVTAEGTLSGNGTVNAGEIAIGGTASSAAGGTASSAAGGTASSAAGGTVSPGSATASIGKLTVGGGEMVLGGAAVYRAQVSLADESAGADLIEVSTTGSLRLEGTIELTGIDRTSADWGAAVSRKIVNSPTGAVVDAGFTVEPPRADDATSHIGQGAFLRGVNPTATGVDLDLFIAMGGDTDGDGMVGLDDWDTFRNNFGRTGMKWTDGNFGPWDDGTVDLDDWDMLRNNFGKVYAVAEGGAAAVPEPGTLVMLLAGLAGLAVVLRRRRA